MACPMSEAKLESLRVDFDRRFKLEVHGDGAAIAEEGPRGIVEHAPAAGDALPVWRLHADALALVIGFPGVPTPARQIALRSGRTGEP